MNLGGQGPIIRRTFPGLETFREILLDGIPLYLATNAGWTTAVTGSGAVTQAVAALDANTGTTTGSTARAYTLDLYLPGGTNVVVDFSKRILWGFSIRRATASDADVIGRVQLKAATTEGALAASGIGVRVANLTLTGESYRTAGAFTATIQAMSAGVVYNVVVDHEPAVPRIRFYVNGVLQATVTDTANIPNANTASVGMIVSVLNGAGTANAFNSIAYPFLFQEH